MVLFALGTEGQMRGRFRDQGGLFSYLSPEKRVPKDHPLRRVRPLVWQVLHELSAGLGRLYLYMPHMPRSGMRQIWTEPVHSRTLLPG
jgi:hypothetical protein